ncbi:hypothetical protein DFJ77DRAFT_299590 [Powellomyces hirtus]|nr:hypothetical protein DFJ77DRAFT_299590 [Powellomyces hirtus]
MDSEAIAQRVCQLTHHHLRSFLKRRLSGFVVDLLTVVMGVRSAFLNDYFFADKEKLNSYIEDLRQVSRETQGLCAVLINEEQCIFYHRKPLLQRLQRDLASDFVALTFIDASPDLKDPVLCRSDFKEATQETFRLLIEALQSLPYAAATISFLTPHRTDIPAINGWLIGYAVIYCIRPVQRDGTCLNNIPLILYECIAEYREEQESRTVVIMSFSCPVSLAMDSLEDVEAAFKGTMQKQFQTQSFFQNLTIAKSTVSQPIIIL